MLTTLLEPYALGAEYMYEPGGQKGQGVSYYVGHDAGVGKVLDHPLLNGLAFAASFGGDNPLMKWCPNDTSGNAAFFLYSAMTQLNRAARKIYAAYQSLNEIDENLSQLNPKHPSYIRLVKAYMTNTEAHTSGIREIIGGLHFFYSVLLFRANRIKDSSAKWPRIGDFRRLYELLDDGDKEAKDLKEIVFQNDGDGLMEKLAVETTVMHDLLDSVNIYTMRQSMFPEDVPAIVMVGPPKDNEHGFLVHNHAVSQIMAGVDIIVSRFGLLDTKDGQA